MESSTAKQPITIAAIGDIAFVGKRLKHPDIKLFDTVRSVFQNCDLVIGNLECPLIEKGKTNPQKCSLKGDPGWAKILKTAGIDYVSLANNHMMDYAVQGMESTWRYLNAAGIRFSGAGINLDDSSRPEIIEIKGQRIGILAYSSVVVASQCFADNNQPGVAPFSLEKVLIQIAHLQSDVDFIILCLHWGIEHYRYPTPEQREIARQLTRAGVSLIIGHHSHTLQGSEKINGGMAIYSLGNFIFDDFVWNQSLPDGTISSIPIMLSDNNRMGAIFRVVLGESSVSALNTILTYIGGSGSLEVSQNPKSKSDYQALSKLFTIPGYKYIWRLYSLYLEWQLRLSNLISIKKIRKNFKKIRPKHFKRLFVLMTRSFRIVAGKTTNPYD